MRILIIEDEALAANKLISFIERYFSCVQVIARLDKVSDVIAFFDSPQSLDIIFSDIELLDGQVFNALNDLDLPCPVIYTTSYNQYWSDAFKNQGVEYLLKPFSFRRFSQAMTNFEQLKSNFETEEVKVENKKYKNRFLLRKSQTVEVLKVDTIVCFKAASGIVSAYDKHKKHHMLSVNTITELVEQIDPQLFFRINRSEIINLNYITYYENYGKDTIAVFTSVLNEPLITSKTKTAQFKKWLDG
jgi:DNA-binding LytR/AlgR family response regulator